jgi:hypothetical protein
MAIIGSTRQCLESADPKDLTSASFSAIAKIDRERCLDPLLAAPNNAAVGHFISRKKPRTAKPDLADEVAGNGPV